MGVAFFEKSGVRALLRIARGRGIRVAEPTDEQLNDPAYIAATKKRFGRYPNDLTYSKAKKLAERLGITLTEAQRMNHFACQQFIAECRAIRAAPSLDQIDLMHLLAKLKRVSAPEECDTDFTAWKRFMAENLTRDDLDRGHDALARLQKGGVDMASLGGQVYALSLAAMLDRRGMQALVERVDELLLRGFYPDNVADDLDVECELVYERARHLEGLGHDLSW